MNYLFQVDRNDGSCFLKTCMALRLNDLIHAWGLDMQLGYCAQGDRTKNVGVVDAEYIVHYNCPTLGGIDKTPVRIQKCGIFIREFNYAEMWHRYYYFPWLPKRIDIYALVEEKILM